MRRQYVVRSNYYVLLTIVIMSWPAVVNAGGLSDFYINRLVAFTPLFPLQILMNNK